MQKKFKADGTMYEVVEVGGGLAETDGSAARPGGCMRIGMHNPTCSRALCGYVGGPTQHACECPGPVPYMVHYELQGASVGKCVPKSQSSSC